LYELQKSDILGSAPPFDFSELEKMQLEIENFLDTKQPLTIKDLAVTGMILLPVGYTAGILLGETLQRLLTIVLENPDQNQRELLLDMARDWRNGTVD
jgi:tRNA nucleotidyltransferase (CCA-adding enzyme)